MQECDDVFYINEEEIIHKLKQYSAKIELKKLELDEGYKIYGLFIYFADSYGCCNNSCDISETYCIAYIQMQKLFRRIQYQLDKGNCY